MFQTTNQKSMKDADVPLCDIKSPKRPEQNHSKDPMPGPTPWFRPELCEKVPVFTVKGTHSPPVSGATALG